MTGNTEKKEKGASGPHHPSWLLFVGISVPPHKLPAFKKQLSLVCEDNTVLSLESL